MKVLTNITLMGRQLGVFLVIAQQQTNAKNLPTELRENIPLKIILGDSRTRNMSQPSVWNLMLLNASSTSEKVFLYIRV